ncbi:hypothetical protein ACM91Y_002161 [Cronobacter dublinensis]
MAWAIFFVSETEKIAKSRRVSFSPDVTAMIDGIKQADNDRSEGPPEHTVVIMIFSKHRGITMALTGPLYTPFPLNEAVLISGLAGSQKAHLFALFASRSRLKAGLRRPASLWRCGNLLIKGGRYV